MNQRQPQCHPQYYLNQYQPKPRQQCKRMQPMRWSIGLLTLIVLIGCGGCSSPRMPGEAQHGSAVRAAFASQVIDPQAGLVVRTNQGLAGAAAKASVERYFRSFEVPAATSNLFTIGMGAGAAGSTAAPAVTTTR